MTMATQIGELAVRRSIEINAPPERVWEEFASQERMARWLTSPDSTEIGNRRLGYEPRVGGVFETEGVHAGVTPFVFTGRVLVYDPPRELTTEMGVVYIGDDRTAWPEPTLLTFLVTPVAGGRSRVEIVHHAFERLGDAARETYQSFEGGWNLAPLTALRNIVQTGRAK